MTGLAYPAPGDPLLQVWRGSAATLLDATADQGPVWWLRGARMRTRRGLMDEWAAAAQFPPHFGGNWDALRDALADLPEGGTFLILDAEQLFQEAPPVDGITWLAVLRVAAEELAPKPFRVILQAQPSHYQDLAAGVQALLEGNPEGSI